MEPQERLKKLLDRYEQLRAKSQYDDLSDLKEEALSHNMRVVEAVASLSKPGSSYATQAESWLKVGLTNAHSLKYRAACLALYEDAKDGLL